VRSRAPESSASPLRRHAPVRGLFSLTPPLGPLLNPSLFLALQAVLVELWLLLLGECLALLLPQRLHSLALIGSARICLIYDVFCRAVGLACGGGFLLRAIGVPRLTASRRVLAKPRGLFQLLTHCIG
jgi:hypothetical protein